VIYQLMLWDFYLRKTPNLFNKSGEIMFLKINELQTPSPQQQHQHQE
jgi:hypothetical protein